MIGRSHGAFYGLGPRMGRFKRGLFLKMWSTSFIHVLISFALLICYINADYIDFSIKVEDVIPSAQRAILESRQTLDKIGSLQPEECTVETVVEPYALQESQLQLSMAAITILGLNSPNPQLREVCTTAGSLVSDYKIQRDARLDIRRSFPALVKNLGNKLDALDPETRKFINAFIQDEPVLSEAQRNELATLRTKLGQLTTAFEKNKSTNVKAIWLRPIEIDGCSIEQFGPVNRQTFHGMEYIGVNLTDKVLSMILTYGRNSETRRKVYMEKYTDETPNEKILNETVLVRARIAHLLGYATHADKALQDNLAKTGARVREFEKNLIAHLRPFARQELEKLKALKAKELGIPLDQAVIHPWDKEYYTMMLKQREYPIDSQTREYFETTYVRQQMLLLFGNLFGLKFTPVALSVWHEDVYSVRVNDTDTGEVLGYLYFDLFTRPGKFSGNACITFVNGHVRNLKTGEREPSRATISTFFTRPTETMPSLLGIDQVRTLFHEFGHAMHNICARTKFSRFSGSQVERDFVEAPSQMLENWVWKRATLKRVSRHYKTGAQLADDVIDRMINEAHCTTALSNLEKANLGLLDNLIHSIRSDLKLPTGHGSIRELYADSTTKATLIPVPPGTFNIGMFSHTMFAKYDAAYYGYMWSKALSADMFASRFGVEGLNNPVTGMAYRREILQPGGTRDAMASVRAFLGREPNNDAFVRSLAPKPILQNNTAAPVTPVVPNPAPKKPSVQPNPNPSPAPPTSNTGGGGGNRSSGGSSGGSNKKTSASPPTSPISAITKTSKPSSSMASATVSMFTGTLIFITSFACIC